MALDIDADTIDDVLSKAGIAPPEDIELHIDQDEDLAGRGLYGHTWPDGSRVTLCPDAFENEEQLLRTLVHEFVHVAQVRQHGATTNSVLLAMREREAYDEEERWWLSYREQQ